MNSINSVSNNHELLNRSKRVRRVREATPPEKLHKPRRDSNQNNQNHGNNGQSAKNFNKLFQKHLIHEDAPIDAIEEIELIDQEEKLRREYQKVIDVYLRSIKEYQEYIQNETPKEYTYESSRKM